MTRARWIRHPATALAALLLGIMVDIFALGSTVLPHTLAGVLPSGPHGYRGFRPEQVHAISIDPAGAFEAEFAWAGYFVRSMKGGAFPLWNPHQGLGQPQLGNYVPALMFPVNWATLVLPPAWWDLVGLIDWFLAAWFTYLLGRVLGLGRPGALAAGASVYAIGFLPAFLEVRSIAGTVSSFPALLYSVERTIRQPRWRWSPLAVGGATYCLAAGGHPSPAIFGLLAAAAYLCLRVARDSAARRSLGAVVAPMLCGGLLAAPQLVSFAEHVLRDSLPTHDAGRGLEHFSWRALPMSVFPFIYGPMNFTIARAGDVGPTWIPASVTCLAVFGLCDLGRRRASAGLAALVIPCALIAAKDFGMPIVNDLGRLPLIAQLTVDYSLGIALVVVAVLAGNGCRAILRRPIQEWRTPLIAWFLWAAAMLAIALWTSSLDPTWYASSGWRVAHNRAALFAGLFWVVAFPWSLVATRRMRPDRTSHLMFVVFAGIALQAAASFPNGSPQSFLLIQVLAATAFAVAVTCAWLIEVKFRPALVAAGLAAVVVGTATLVRPRVPDRYDALTSAPYIDFLAAQPNAPRVLPLEAILSPDFASAFGLSSVTNIDNLVTREGGEFISTFLDRGVFPARYFGADVMRNPSVSGPLDEFWRHKPYWDLAGVRFVITAGHNPNDSPARAGAEPLLSEVYRSERQTYGSLRESSVSIWQNSSAFDRAFLATRPVAVPDASHAMNALETTTDLHRTVYIEGGACAGTPAWPATVAAGRLLGFQLSPNRVTVEYDNATPGVLTLTDAYARGWRVRVDGQEATLLRADAAFRGVCLDRPGRHEITFDYRPPGWTLALALCAFGAVGTGGLLFKRRGR